MSMTACLERTDGRWWFVQITVAAPPVEIKHRGRRFVRVGASAKYRWWIYAEADGDED